MIANLMKDRDVAFRVTSMPGADSMMIGIYAVLAQKEREMISERTRAALKSARERGIKLGGARAGGVEKSAESRIAKADQGAERAYHIVRPLRDAGLSFRKIAHNLNAMGLKTAGGSDWEARSVLRVIERMEKTL
jgi:DNA invertase Pin-like site-specific DNA recombinase